MSPPAHIGLSRDHAPICARPIWTEKNFSHRVHAKNSRRCHPPKSKTNIYRQMFKKMFFRATGTICSHECAKNRKNASRRRRTLNESDSTTTWLLSNMKIRIDVEGRYTRAIQLQFAFHNNKKNPSRRRGTLYESDTTTTWILLKPKRKYEWS